jgi:hypothetical protein
MAGRIGYDLRCGWKIKRLFENRFALAPIGLAHSFKNLHFGIF